MSLNNYDKIHSSSFLKNLPTSSLFVAVHSYRPRKLDELELKKGHLYSVTDRCQDGWCKGVCQSTERSGVFPGNYVKAAGFVNLFFPNL